MWDATQYLRFGGERARPFFDLLARVGAEQPDYVVDMGCGPGNLTVLLAERWPSAAVCGVDSSPQMIEAAQRLIPVAVARPAGSGPVLTSRRARAVLHARRRAALGAAEPARRDRLQRGAAVGARPSRAAGPLGGLAGRRRLAGVPGPGELRSAIARDPARDGGLAPVAPAAAGRGAEPAVGRSGRLRRAAGRGRPARSTPGRRRTCTSWRATIRCSSGTRARDCVRSWPCSTRTRPRTSWPSTASGSARRIRRARSVPSSRSAGCSPSPTGAKLSVFFLLI